MSRASQWPTRTIDELCLSIVDCVNRTAPVVKGPTPFRMIRTTNIRDGFVDLTETRFVEEEVFKTWTRRQMPEPGDIILTREAPLGEVGLLRGGCLAFLGQRLVSYRTNPVLLDNRYFLYYLRSDAGRGQVLALGSGSTVHHMRVPEAKRLRILTPPIDEQRRIGAILGAYDDLIDVNRRRVAVLEHMSRRLFEEWFVRFRFQNHEPRPLSGVLPRGWLNGELGELAQLEYGRALKATKRFPGSVDVYGSSGHVGQHNEPLVHGPGVIVGRKGNVGAVIWSPRDFWPIDTVYYVRSEYPLTYLYELLKLLPFQNTDAAVPGLNRSGALKMPVVIPPIDVCRRYHCKVSAKIELRDVLLIANQRLAASRDLLLPRLISGQLSVAAAERELLEAA